MIQPESNISLGAFREMPYMGVIYVVVEAMKLGYKAEDPSWSNLGQGQPEVGELEGAPPRYATFNALPADHAYGPVEGLPELRETIAAHYNRLYRRGMSSQYSAQNVVVAAGGRTTLTRAGAALGQINLGYFTPDYTAYEDLLSAFMQINPIHIELCADESFAIDPQKLEQRIIKDGLNALLISNPCNPTGRVISGKELCAWVDLSRKHKTTLLLDEYYSHFIWKTFGTTDAGPVSSAAFVEDVDKDPVVIFDGLTKNFRYPGWRLGWVIGPKEMIKNITAAGSFVDGGPSRPIQRGAIDVLEPRRADQETEVLRRTFIEKRNILVSTLKDLGVEFPLEPEGTFYAWGSIEKLPPPLNQGMDFFREALKNKVLTVPGEFFDVNPRKKRRAVSPFSQYIRFSYGPPKQNMINGLDRLVNMITKIRR